MISVGMALECIKVKFQVISCRSACAGFGRIIEKKCLDLEGKRQKTLAWIENTKVQNARFLMDRCRCVRLIWLNWSFNMVHINAFLCLVGISLILRTPNVILSYAILAQWQSFPFLYLSCLDFTSQHAFKISLSTI